MIGRLSPGDSFGETTVLKGFAMPCSVITDTHVLMGTISTLDVHGTFGAERIGVGVIQWQSEPSVPS